MSEAQVHEAAQDVLRFWLEETPRELHFKRDAALDAAIAERFGALRDRIVATDAAGWDGAPRALLAAVIVIDQFSRNLFRGSGRAYEADGLARRLTCSALDRGWDAGLSPDEQTFLYMPLMHSEDMRDQDDSVRLFIAHGLTDNVAFAEGHRDVIARFGRFPSRNAALGRASTAAEEAYLSQPDARW
jgi:uncharacterized protein (DUF924 family)